MAREGLIEHRLTLQQVEDKHKTLGEGLVGMARHNTDKLPDRLELYMVVVAVLAQVMALIRLVVLVLTVLLLCTSTRK